MPQNDYMDLFRRRFGRRFDHEERMRKKADREPHEISKKAKTLRRIKGKLFSKKRYAEKVALRKKIKAYEEKQGKPQAKEQVPDGAIPAYLLDRKIASSAKILSNMIRQKRKEKAKKWNVPVPTVRSMTEDQMFGVVRTGKRKKKTWKRVVRNICFVDPSFTRKPPAFERFIRPTALRFKSAHVYHPQLKITSKLNILQVKKNPQSSLMTKLGCITKGTIIEVDVSCMGLLTETGKVIWGKYAQVTNNPEFDGCINAVLLV